MSEKEPTIPPPSDRISHAVSKFQSRLHNGEKISLDEYVEDYPDIAEQLRERLTPFVEETISVQRDAPVAEGLKESRSLSLDSTGQFNPTHSSEIAFKEATATCEGQRFGDYLLQKEIARGGMGVVYRARQISADRIVALKVIRPDQLSHSPEDEHSAAVSRFRNEVQAAAKIEHDNVVTVYDVGEVDGRVYYAMRFVDGASLRDRLNDGPLEPKVAARYIEEVARALAEAHAHGILHRDLKPHNVMVDAKTDRAMLTDFGLAKLTECDQQLTASEAILGSPPYMSPEQTLGAEKVTVASDIYGLGATLYHLLTGRPPFQAASVMETLKQILDQEPVPIQQLNPAIDRDLETICLKCLEKKPTQRYESAQAFAEELGRYLRGEPILARPISGSQRAWRWCKRKPLIAGLTAAVILLMLAGTGVSTYFAIESANNASFFRTERDRADAKAAEAELAKQQALNAEQKATDERDRALDAERRTRLEAARVQAVSDFLVNDLLVFASPERESRRDLTLSDVLDLAADKIDERFVSDPLIKASIHEVVGQAYQSLDRQSAALHHFQQQYELAKKHQASDHEATLIAQANYALALHGEGGSEGVDYEALLEDAYGQARSIRGEADLLTLKILDKLITARIDNSIQSEPQGGADQPQHLAECDRNIELARRLLDARTATHGLENGDSAQAMLLYGFALKAHPSHQGASGNAEIERGYNLLLEHCGSSHPDTLHAALLYGSQVLNPRDLEANKVFFAEASERATTSLGGGHRLTGRLMNVLAVILDRSGKRDEAQEVLQRLLELQQQDKAEKESDILKTRYQLAYREATEGDVDVAIAELGAIGQRSDEIKYYQLSLKAYRQLASLHIKLQHAALAEEAARHYVRIHKESGFVDTANTIEMLASLILSLGMQAKFDETPELCADYVERSEALFNEGQPEFKTIGNFVNYVFNRHAALVVIQQKEEEIAAALEVLSQRLGPTHAIVNSAVNSAMEAFAEKQRWEKGEAFLFTRLRSAEAASNDEWIAQAAAAAALFFLKKAQGAADRRDWTGVADAYYERLKLVDVTKLSRSGTRPFAYAFGLAEHREGYELLRPRLWKLLDTAPGHVFLGDLGRQAAMSSIEDGEYLERARKASLRGQYRHVTSRAQLHYQCGDYDRAKAVFDRLDDSLDCRFVAAAIAAKLGQAQAAKDYYNEAVSRIEVEAMKTTDSEAPSYYNNWLSAAVILVWRREAERAMGIPESPLRLPEGNFSSTSDIGNE